MCPSVHVVVSVPKLMQAFLKFEKGRFALKFSENCLNKFFTLYETINGQTVRISA
jgi:hypothetical protein